MPFVLAILKIESMLKYENFEECLLRNELHSVTLPNRELAVATSMQQMYHAKFNLHTILELPTTQHRAEHPNNMLSVSPLTPPHAPILYIAKSFSTVLLKLSFHC